MLYPQGESRWSHDAFFQRGVAGVLKRQNVEQSQVLVGEKRFLTPAAILQAWQGSSSRVHAIWRREERAVESSEGRARAAVGGAVLLPLWILTYVCYRRLSKKRERPV